MTDSDKAEKRFAEALVKVREGFRKWRKAKLNHEFMVFLVFLCVAVCFWFLQVFKESASVSLDYEFRLCNVPKNVIVTSQVPRTISVVVNGRGFSILEYLANGKSRHIDVDFGQFSCSDGLATLSNVALKRIVSKELAGGVKLSSVNPQSLDLYYSKGERKRVPVVFKGKVTPGNQYLICGIFCEPESVDIYAPSGMLDSINAVYTEGVNFTALEDTTKVTLALQSVRGVKYVPDSVSVNICVDLYAEKTLSLPIYCENIPQNKVLRTFPLRADVKFHASATRFNSITENDFALVVDYSSIRSGDTRCRLQLRAKPEDVTHLRISPEYVEYVVEQIEE